MPLPHYSQSKASRENYEPVQGNLFEVTFLAPSGVGGAEILLEHVNTIGGLNTNPEIPAVEQKYKFSTRSYLGMPDTTAIDVVINFSLNLNDGNQNYVYKTLQEWYKKGYDPETGEMGIKRNYTGSIVVVMFNRAGDIYRKVSLKSVFPINGVPLGDLDNSSAEPLTLEITFRCDDWKEEHS